MKWSLSVYCTNPTKWTSKINIPTYALQRHWINSRWSHAASRFSPRLCGHEFSPSWIYIYHSFITSIVLYYMVCFPNIPHCCRFSSPSATGRTFYLQWAQGQSGCFIDSDVFPLVVRGVEEEKERDAFLHCWVGRWHCRRTKQTATSCLKKKKTCFMPSISFKCFHVREFSFDVLDCARFM